MATAEETTHGACAYVVGDDGLSRWSKPTADAWIGLVETQRRLTREIEALIEQRYGIGLSEVEVLGRLAAADDQRMRVSALAEATGLSVSRVSRVVDALERRELVRRQPCPGDGRAINAHLLPDGLKLARAAQADHFTAIQDRFFANLSAEEVETLATVFARFSPGAARACDASA